MNVTTFWATLREKIASLLRSRILQFLLAFSMVKIALFYLIVQHNQQVGINRDINAEFMTGDDFFDLFGTRWDSAYYLRIAMEGYSQDILWAFPPGYPLLIRMVSSISGVSVTISAVVVAQVLGLFSIVLLWHASKYHVTTNSERMRIIMLYAFFPQVLVYTSVAYSESAFLCSMILSWIFYQEVKKELAANSPNKKKIYLFSLSWGFFAAYAALTRYPGFLLAVIYPVLLSRHPLSHIAKTVFSRTPQEEADSIRITLTTQDFVPVLTYISIMIIFFLPWIIPALFLLDAINHGLFTIQLTFWGQKIVLFGGLLERASAILSHPDLLPAILNLRDMYAVVTILNFMVIGVIALPFVLKFKNEIECALFALPFFLLYLSTSGIGSFGMARYCSTIFPAYILLGREYLQKWQLVAVVNVISFIIGLYLLQLFVSWQFWG